MLTGGDRDGLKISGKTVGHPTIHSKQQPEVTENYKKSIMNYLPSILYKNTQNTISKHLRTAINVNSV